ncbi:RidA family protein [Paenibacillus sp. GCM10012306]|uniref:RidA family protein n=1 Tax=Paenibacillus sp. GCM10012306 TaxID=3317342 RepID=UPI00360C1141
MTVENRLRQAGIVLPSASEPAAKYANCVLVNGFLFVSGKGPSSKAKGKLGQKFTTEQGYRYARETGLEILAVVKDFIGSLDKVKRVVKIQGFVNATGEFEEHHKVLNGCSDLLKGISLADMSFVIECSKL